jgi:hypothetical protein
MHKVHKDRALLIATAKQSRADLEEQMSKDKALRSATSAKAKADADATAKLFGLPT